MSSAVARYITPAVVTAIARKVRRMQNRIYSGPAMTANIGWRAGKYVMDNRAAIMRIAAGARRAWKGRGGRGSKRGSKNRELFSRRKIGQNVGSGFNYKQLVQFGEDSVPTRTLFSYDLISISEGLSENTRYRDLANVTGFGIHYTVCNLATSPMYGNWAILALKETSDAADVPITNDNFFRQQTNVRGQGFFLALTASEFHWLPINTDKFIILRHHRYSLGRRGDFTDTALPAGQYDSKDRPNHKHYKIWCPLRRQIRFALEAAGGVEEANSQVYFVTWFDKMGSVAGTLGESGQVRAECRSVVYFKQTRVS